MSRYDPNAQEIAGVSQTDFLRTLGEHGIPMHYDESDFEADLSIIAAHEVHQK